MNDALSPVLIASLPVLVVVGWLIWSYNRFISQRAGVNTAWAGVDVQLQRRHDLVPSLVETVKGYAKHEHEVLEQVIEARAAAVRADKDDEVGPAEQAVVEVRLGSHVRQLLAVAEGYPDLKAAPLFLDLQAQLVEAEDRIAASRRIYNLNVRDYNVRVQQVPSNLIANSFNFELFEYFDAEVGTDAAPTFGTA